MADITPNWGAVATPINGAALNAASDVTEDIDLATSTWDEVEVQFRWTSPGAAMTGTYLVEVYRSVDGANDDTIASGEGFVYDLSNGVTDGKTINLIGGPYRAIKISNTDASENITHTVKVRGRAGYSS